MDTCKIFGWGIHSITIRFIVISGIGYLCAELDVGTHGVHDDLLCDCALITDPEGKANDTSEPTGGHHVGRLEHLQHRLPVGLFLPLGV